MEILNWFVTSSQDPAKISLFIKSVSVLAVLIGIDQAVVNQAGNDLANLVVGVGMVIAALTSVVGLTRKVHLGRWSAT